MTDHKHLKTRIRDRMSRTGEAYTSARRHVLSVAAPSGSGPLLVAYPAPGGGQSRDAAIATHVLRACGVTGPDGAPLSEAMVAGLAGGIGFLYAVFEYRDQAPTMTIVARHHPEPYLETAIRRAVGSVDERHTGSPRVAASHLDDVLAGGRPAVCTVQRDGLPWNGAGSLLASADPYDVAVIGADATTVWLDDDSVHPLPVDRETFGRARTAHRKGRHRLVTVPATRAGTRISEPDLAAAITDALSTTAAHLTGPVLGHAFDVNFGLSGMVRLRDQLADPAGRTGWQSRFGTTGEGTFIGLTRLRAGIEEEYTAPAASRPLFAEFLREAAIVTRRPALLHAADLADGAGRRWQAVADQAVAGVPALAAYEDLLRARGDLRTTLAPERYPDLRAVENRLADRRRAFIAGGGLDTTTQRALFDALAEKVDEALALERELATAITA